MYLLQSHAPHAPNVLDHIVEARVHFHTRGNTVDRATKNEDAALHRVFQVVESVHTAFVAGAGRWGFFAEGLATGLQILGALEYDMLDSFVRCAANTRSRASLWRDLCHQGVEPAIMRRRMTLEAAL